MISALRPTFLCKFLIAFCFFLVGVHLFTVRLEFFLPFLPVFSTMSFHVQFCQRFTFGFLLPWFQTALRQMLSSGLPRLLPEYSPFEFCCAPCRSFCAQPDIIWSTHYFCFSFCFRSVHSFPGRVVGVLLKSCEIFFNAVVLDHHFFFGFHCLRFHPVHFSSICLKTFVCASSCILANIR